MIDKSKETYLQYRERARELYARVAVVHGELFGTNQILEEVKIPEHANVQICEHGAFVEAVVWVPSAKFKQPTASSSEIIDEGPDQGRFDAGDRCDG